MIKFSSWFQIKQYKEYISELVLHAEAQASQYQQKVQYLVCQVLNNGLIQPKHILC